MPNLAAITEEADLRRLFGLFPTGVTALGAMEDARPVGMTASAFVAVSLNPPLVSVCIKRGSWTWRRLRARPRIGISFLGDSHAVAARQLAQTGDNRFSGLDYQVGPEGALSWPARRPGWTVPWRRRSRRATTTSSFSVSTARPRPMEFRR